MMNLYERNQKQRNFFNEKIETYDDVHSTFMGTKNTLADNLDKDTKKILDLGAGTGLELIHLFELFPNAKVTVIDITENMLEKLKQRSFSSQVTTICADFFKTDFGKNYDAVISTSALHHFKPKEKQKLYQKIYNCLKDNGQFINCDYIALTQEIQDKQLYELDHNIDNYKHIDTPLTVNNETNILKEVGFKDITSTNTDIKDYKLIKARKK
ncbi:MAG: methyltransferase domain-containing protein [Bacilli bacterium]|nr:methyltransferase domain-containing protein [Bacilli bacterium]